MTFLVIDKQRFAYSLFWPPKASTRFRSGQSRAEFLDRTGSITNSANLRTDWALVMGKREHCEALTNSKYVASAKSQKATSANNSIQCSEVADDVARESERLWASPTNGRAEW